MNSKIYKILKEYSIMSIALAIFVFGWTAFLIPNQITGGGIIGLSSVINYATGISVSYIYFGINILLLIVGFIVLGNNFGIKTFFCVLVSSLFFEIFPLIPWVSNIQDSLINAIIGGAMSGIGIALVFTQGGSTGGVDIVALIITKYWEISPGKIFMASDFLIISSILLLPDKSLQDMVYGYIEVAAFSYTLDQMLTGSKQSIQMLIITNKYNELADKLCFKMNKGVTAINSIGWYKKTDSKIIMVVTRKNQMPEVMNAIKEVDNKAFITVSTVMGVYGEGFQQIKE